MKRENGDGSITKLKGRKRPYWARVTIGFDGEGNQKRKSLGTYQYRAQAEQALLDYQASPRKFDEIRFYELFEAWKNTRFKNIKPATQEMYLANWNFYKPLYNTRVTELKTADFQFVIDNNISYSRSYLKQIKSLGIQLCRYAMANDLLDKNYAEFIELKTEEKKEKKILTDKEINLLFENKGDFAVDTTLVLVYTGMRITELLTLTKDDVNIEAGYIKHGIKTSAGIDRIIPISSKIKDIIERYYNQSTKYLFAPKGKKMRSDYYRDYIFYPMRDRFGFSSDITPHNCRHTYASILNKYVSNKEHIARLLGHTDYAVSANVYTHTDIDELIKSISKIE